MTFKPGELNGRPWKKGHHSTHDLAAAGRRAKAVSPWRFGNMRTPRALQLREKWHAEGTRIK